MSDIFLAKMVGANGFQKPLVIKKLLPQYSNKSSYVRRFVNEGKTLARLNHSNIVQILDTGIIDGEYFIAMEYIEGRNVAHIVSKAAKTRRPPSLEFILHVALEVVRGLAYSHRKKGPSGENLMLVHQDVNSFNVMVSYEAEVKIIDFGIARIFLDEKTKNGLPVAGKLLYFSPEQLQRRPLDRRVDIYGTGVLFYEMLTGDRLVKHQDTIAETVRTILEMNVRDRVTSNEKIHPELRPILVKAMALDPMDRYSWMEEMMDDLRAVVNRLRLDMDPRSFSRYMREQFHREVLLDRRRMRKLASESPARGSAVAFDRGAGFSGRSPTQRQSTFEGGLRLSSWPFGREAAAAEEDKTQLVTRSVSFANGTTIFSGGERGSDIYVIVKGKVRISLDLGRSSRTLALLGEGDILGEMAIVGEQARSLTAKAEENCELVCLSKEELARLVDQDLACRIIFNLVEKLRDAHSFVRGVLLDDSLTRLIFALIYLHRRGGQLNGTEIDLRELQALFRLEDSDQVKKYLSKLESLDVIRASENVVRVTNVERLEIVLNALMGRGGTLLKL